MKQLTPMDSHFYYFEGPNQAMNESAACGYADQTTAPDGLVRHKIFWQKRIRR